MEKVLNYRLRRDVVVDFTNQSKIAKRAGIAVSTLNRILHRNCNCSKPVAMYITYLNKKALKERFNDNCINEYFEEIKKG